MRSQIEQPALSYGINTGLQSGLGGKLIRSLLASAETEAVLMGHVRPLARAPVRCCEKNWHQEDSEAPRDDLDQDYSPSSLDVARISTSSRSGIGITQIQVSRCNSVQVCERLHAFQRVGAAKCDAGSLAGDLNI